MQFNSIEFLFCFLPLFLAVYRIFPEGKRHIPLLAGSLIFYVLSCSGSYWPALVLCACAVLVYLAGLDLARGQSGLLLTISLGALGGILMFFKLFAGGKYLPAGMSFYLFQMAAYLIDIWRCKIKPERSLMVFGSRITMFPKLLSGPLMEPKQLFEEQPDGKFTRFREGLCLLILGLGFKVILASRLGGIWSESQVAGFAYISVPFAWLALISYAMKLYFDFYGYSLMAMGLGKMLGFQLPENFIDPYAAKSVSEFYRRWHVTLGAWFREYLYIPLGGNRKGVLRTILNLAVVWAFTGLWHGVGGNYMIWAGIIFVFVVLERLFLGAWLKKSRILCHVYTVFVILMSWVPFAVSGWDQMVLFYGRLFGVLGSALNTQDYMSWIGEYVGLLTAGVFFATPVPRKLWQRLKDTVWMDVLVFVLFWAVVYFISTAAQDPFLYFQY